MWDYVAFFGYNFIFFLFALLVWYVFPKPVPYDYTTIPGLKNEGDVIENGNLAEMQASGNMQAFLKQLHEDYGALASFYWGSRYVVAAGSFRLWREITMKTRKIAAKVDFIPFTQVGGTEPMISSVEEFTEELRRSSSSNISDYQRIADLFDPGLEKKNESVVTFMKDHKAIITDYEHALVGKSYDDVALEYCDSDKGKRLRIALIYNAIQRCLSRTTVDEKANELMDSDTPSFSDLPPESPLRLVILESMRLAIPFEHLFCIFTEEIDLYGHPIPAGIPIVLRVNDLCMQAKDASSFIPGRFLHKSGHSLGECLQLMPHFPVIASTVISYLTTKGHST